MIDSRFSLENIENAAAIAQDNSSTNQQAALDLINEWMEQPSSIFTALELIRTTSSFYTSFIASSLIKNKISHFWGQMSIDQRVNYRDLLSTLIGTAPDIDNNISYNLIHALCYIAIFDWPDEYPSFSDIIFPAPNSETLRISLRILSTFMEEIESTTIITDLHRNNLRQHIITVEHAKITSLISAYITVPELSVDALAICNYMLLWGSTEDIVDFDLFQKLSLEFLTNEKTCEKAVQCLNSIFISRTDSAIAFRTFSPFLADALSKGVFPNQQPVTLNPHVMTFLLRFLLEYSSVFELALTYNQAKDDQNTMAFIDENVSILVETMEQKGISPETLHNDLIHLYQIILSIPPDELTDDLHNHYWQLWDNNLRRVCYEQNHNMPVNPASTFFITIINEIRQALYNALGSSIDEDGMCPFQTRTTIASLYMINQSAYLEFMKIQPPSPQLCYAIGTIEFVLDFPKLDSVLLIVIELLQHASTDQSPEYQTALLFALSHSTKCFQSNNQLFSQFIDFVCASMTGNEKVVANAATCALQYVVQRRVGLFKGDSSYFAELLISQSEVYLRNMDPQAAIRIFRVCMWLICYNKRNNNNISNNISNNNSSDNINTVLSTSVTESTEPGTFDEGSTQELYMKLFAPIITVMVKPGEFNLSTVETSLDIIRECCYASPSSSKSIFGLLWPPLSQLASSMIPNANFQNSSLSYVFGALSSLQINMPFEQVSPQVNDVFALMVLRQHIEDSFFEYFTILRDTFSELDAMYPHIHAQLIVPFLSSEEPLPAAMFMMIGQFSPNVVDIEWLTMTVIQAINDLRADVGVDALSALQSMIYKLNKEALMKFISTVAPQLVTAIVGSIVDQMHKPLFVKSVDFLRFIIQSSDFERSEDQSALGMQTMIRDTVANALKQFAQEPSPGFFDNFAAYLISVQRQFFKFKSAFGNLLVVLRKASPGDAELFKIQPAQQNSLFSMLFDTFFKSLVPVFEIRAVNEDALTPNRNKVMTRIKRRRTQGPPGVLFLNSTPPNLPTSNEPPPQPPQGSA